MAKIHQVPTIKLEVTLKLDEGEARALEALMGYGVDIFLKVFYEHIGKHYLSPYEDGLRRLFSSDTRMVLNAVLTRKNKAEKAFKDG